MKLPSHSDILLDLSSSERGLSLSSGGSLVCDDSVSQVALLRELKFFFEMESCVDADSDVF